MSETTATPVAPKKSGLKKILVIISTVLILALGANHFTVKLGYVELGIGVNDSTATVTVKPVEIPGPVATVPADTTKKDTVKIK